MGSERFDDDAYHIWVRNDHRQNTLVHQDRRLKSKFYLNIFKKNRIDPLCSPRSYKKYNFNIAGDEIDDPQRFERQEIKSHFHACYSILAFN